MHVCIMVIADGVGHGAIRELHVCLAWLGQETCFNP